MNCIHCGKGIPSRASFCTECKKYQNHILNFVILLGTLSGGAAVIIGIFTYVATTLPSYWRTMHEKDVSAITLRYNSVTDNLEVVYRNSGAQTAFVRDIMFYFPTRNNALRSFSRSVNIRVEPANVVRHERKKSDVKVEGFSTAFAKGLSSSWALSAEWGQIVFNEKHCFVVQIQESSSFRTSVISEQNKRNKQELLSVPHEVFIRYLPVNSTQWIVKKIPTISTIYTNSDNKRCTEILSEFSKQIRADEVFTP
jgi:hypothetical protein